MIKIYFEEYEESQNIDVLDEVMESLGESEEYNLIAFDLLYDIKTLDEFLRQYKTIKDQYESMTNNAQYYGIVLPD